MNIWIFPCNPSLYDIAGAYRKMPEIDWRQRGTSLAVGDLVCLYVSHNVRAIRFVCKVEQVNMPEQGIPDDEFQYGAPLSRAGRYARLKFIREIPSNTLSFEVLGSHGLKSHIQGQMRVKEPLLPFLSSCLSNEEQTGMADNG